MENKYYIYLSLIAIFLFCFLRPIFVLSSFTSNSIAGINAAEAFTVIFSYSFLILILLLISKIKLDIINIIIFSFCFYCYASLLWGSSFGEVSRLTFPFLCFFITRITVKNEEVLGKISQLVVLGNIIPIIGSFYFVMTERNIKTIYWTGLTRHFGMYANIHSFAHAMCIFLIFAVIFIISKKEISIYYKYLLGILIPLSIFNMVSTYTRTTFLGLYSFLLLYLLGNKKFKYIVALLFVSLLIVITSSSFHEMMYDFIDSIEGKRDILYMGSGRLGIWKVVLEKYLELPFFNKIIGSGIKSFSDSHNDILSLFLNLGIIGLIIYLIMMVKIAYDIFFSDINDRLKFSVLGLLFAVFIMNVVSNSYITRVELAQYLFIILGSYYSIKDNKFIKKDELPMESKNFKI